MRLRYQFVVVAFFAVVLGGCSGGDAQATSYVEPANYDYTVALGGPFECGGWDSGTYRVQVRDHQVVSALAVSQDDQRRVDTPGSGLEGVPTLADIVASFLKAKSEGADVTSYTWDDATGHPVSLCVDPDVVHTVDEEWGFEVSDIVVLNG